VYLSNSAIRRVAVVSALAVLLASPGLRSQAQRPSSFNVFEKSITELQNAMAAGTITSRQIVEQYRARIDACDRRGPMINAFISLNPKALDEAAALDAERKAGRTRGPLHGIPVAIKDNYVTADLPTTGGSLALEGFAAGRDAFAVRKLRQAGAIVIGKTNLHELAYGITSVSSMGGQTRNPYDPSRNPGGSSGGTGAAVGASFAAAGMGTDTCGSIRIPSAHNNLFGLRGTRGLSSRDGIIPLSLTQDIGGPLARSVSDLILMLDATVGFDPADSVTNASDGKIPRTYMSSVGDSSLGNVHVAILTPYFGTAKEDEEVGAIVRKAVASLGSIGARVSEIAPEGFDALLQGTSVINAEFKFDLLDFFAKFGGPLPVRSLDDILRTGLYHNAIDGVLRRANEVESRDTDAYRASLAKRDAATKAIGDLLAQGGITALAYPTIRRKAATVGEQQPGSNCQLSATTGLPAIAMPAGFTADGLPVGLELLGSAFSEPALLRIAYAYERVVNPRRPPASTPALR
jgi:Asp-tRNA(Asn)/Glu-tRNA(Gln) amidotransferase A subunit family amidase